MKPPTAKDRILAVLDSGKKTSRVIAQEAGVSHATASATLTQLKDAGIVRAAGQEPYGRSKAKSYIWEKVKR